MVDEKEIADNEGNLVRLLHNPAGRIRTEFEREGAVLNSNLSQISGQSESIILQPNTTTTIHRTEFEREGFTMTQDLKLTR
jgi:hypothetical protein